MDRKPIYWFAEYSLDGERQLLSRGGEPVRLTPKGLGVLWALVEARGEMVGKRELFARVWPGVIVEDCNLSQHVACLRRVLEDDAGRPRFIETVPRRGYRFVAPVTLGAAPEPRPDPPGPGAAAVPPGPGPGGGTAALPGHRDGAVPGLPAGGRRGRLALLAGVAGMLLCTRDGPVRVQAAAPARAGSAGRAAARSCALGQHFLARRTSEGTFRGLDQFKLAVVQAPELPEAHAGLARAYAMAADDGVLPPAVALPLARAEAERALELDAGLSGAHLAMGTVLLAERAWAAAEAEFQRALRLDPRSVPANQGYAELLVRTGRPSEAAARAQSAFELDPASVSTNLTLALVHFHSGRYGEAVERLHGALLIDPLSAAAHTLLGRTQAELARAPGEGTGSPPQAPPGRPPMALAPRPVPAAEHPAASVRHLALDEPTATRDGRYVAFASEAPDLVPDDDNGAADVFVRDTCRVLGEPVVPCTPWTARVSLSVTGGQADGPSRHPVISGEGTHVAFATRANLDPERDRNDPARAWDIYQVDLASGRVRLVSDPSRASHLAPPRPATTGDGRYVAWISPSPGGELAVRDLVAGTVEVVARGASGEPGLTDDGRYVGFVAGLDAGPDGGAARDGGWRHVHVYDRRLGRPVARLALASSAGPPAEAMRALLEPFSPDAALE